jgi:hypothetical protein
VNEPVEERITVGHVVEPGALHLVEELQEAAHEERTDLRGKLGRDERLEVIGDARARPGEAPRPALPQDLKGGEPREAPVAPHDDWHRLAAAEVLEPRQEPRRRLERRRVGRRHGERPPRVLLLRERLAAPE